jgi:hypothetical protein
MHSLQKQRIFRAQQSDSSLNWYSILPYSRLWQSQVCLLCGLYVGKNTPRTKSTESHAQNVSDDGVPQLFHWYVSLLVRCHHVGYFVTRSFLEGTGLKGASEKLKTRFLSTLFGAWRFWPLANAVNFWFVPMQFRVLYMNVLSLFWTGWLSYVNSKKISLPKNKERKDKKWCVQLAIYCIRISEEVGALSLSD